MIAAIRWLLVASITMCAGPAFADLPPRAVQYLPALKAEITTRWPDMPLPSALAAQVEQETCPSLKSAKCWNPRTELKTDREYGFGLGQLTVTSRFNAWEEVKTMDRGLAGWTWEGRYDPVLQLRALVVKDRFNWRRFPDAAGIDRLAFALAAYNGGVGGVMSDRRICMATSGCDPGQWFGHVEKTSLKARAKVQGYGKSFFDINREYVMNVLNVRRAKYVASMEGWS